MITRAVIAVLACLAAVPAAAQQRTPPGKESPIAGALRKEGERLAEDCRLGWKAVAACAMTIVTDHPVHLALGNIAPQNGFGLGGAVVWAKNNQNYPWSLSADSLRAPAGAWRGGFYFKLRQADQSLPLPVGPGEGSSPSAFVRTIPIYNAYVQAISLPTISYFGLGNETPHDANAFSMKQVIVGGNAVLPVPSGESNRLRIAFLGEVNGRFVRTAGGVSDRLTDRQTFTQFGEGLRAKLGLGPRVHLNYLGQFQQFLSTSGADSSFRRWSIDLGHEFSIYSRFKPASKAEDYTPNDCERKSDGRCLPDVDRLRSADRSWNKSGKIGARLLLSKSKAFNGEVIPFYFQQTLGGHDINGTRTLASYDDYRFRGPNFLVFQETIEHIIAGPLGAWVELNQGRVGLRGERLTEHLRTSFAFGASLNAGAAPMLTVFWATGGPEGHHVGVVLNTALLGGGSRPSLQ